MKIAGYDIDNAARVLSRIHLMTIEQKLDWQNKCKWDIAKFHYDNNEFYDNKIQGRFPDKWEDLPIMQKEDYQIEINKMLSSGYRKNKIYLANTSGSSGNPFFYAKNKSAHAMTWALTQNRYGWHGLNLDSKQARYFGTPLENRSKYYEMVKDLMLNRKKLLIFDLSDEALENHIKLFSRIKFKYIYGYTNSLVLFARYLLRKKITLNSICSTIQICITTSEVLTYEDRKILHTAFGIMIINEYGVSEAGGITAFEDSDSNWILSHETQFIEIVNEDGCPVNIGEEGKILITDLHNKAMPFIRYEVGDIGVLNNKNNSNCITLSKLTGRTNDTILLPSGKKSPGLTFYYISRSILESSGVLKEFIIRQTKVDTFILEIVSDRPLNSKEIKKIQNKMDVYLEPGLTLEINRLHNIKRPKSGKLKHFYSEISDK